MVESLQVVHSQVEHVGDWVVVVVETDGGRGGGQDVDVAV